MNTPTPVNTQSKSNPFSPSVLWLLPSNSLYRFLYAAWEYPDFLPFLILYIQISLTFLIRSNLYLFFIKFGALNWQKKTTTCFDWYREDSVCRSSYTYMIPPHNDINFFDSCITPVSYTVCKQTNKNISSSLFHRTLVKSCVTMVPMLQDGPSDPCPLAFKTSNSPLPHCTKASLGIQYSITQVEVYNFWS